MVSRHQPIEPIKLNLTIKSSFDYDRVSARLRPQPSMGRPDRTGPVISLTVTPLAEFDNYQWLWNMHMAADRLSIVDVLDDFYEWCREERYRFLVEKSYEIGAGEGSDVHHYRQSSRLEVVDII